jgi:hypothetical protein
MASPVARIFEPVSLRLEVLPPSALDALADQLGMPPALANVLLDACLELRIIGEPASHARKHRLRLLFGGMRVSEPMHQPIVDVCHGMPPELSRSVAVSRPTAPRVACSCASFRL